MQKHSFDQGKHVLLSGRRYRLLNSVQIDGSQHWHAIPVGDGAEPIVERFSLQNLERQLGDGLLEFEEEDAPSRSGTKTRSSRRLQLSDKPEAERKYISFWVAIIRAVDDASISANGSYRPLNKADLAQVLQAAAIRFGMKIFGEPKSVSISHYYKMRKRHTAGGLDDLEPNFRARGNRNQMHPLVKRALQEALIERLQECSHSRGSARSPTFTSDRVRTRILEKLEILREAHAGLAHVLKVPSRTTVCKAIAEHDQYQVLVARKGITHARQAMRRPLGHSEPEACLEETQYDETRFDMYCYWGEHRIPLGKPHFSWMLDIYSGGFLGFYLGFEPPSDTVFSSVLRHCCMPKAYMADLYPGFDLPYLMSGIPRFTTFDNSLSAHGKTIERLYGDFDIQYKFCRPREPYTKPDVESAFSALNRSLLQNSPGYAPPLGRKITDYDPTQNGLISFEQLLYLIHRWIAQRHSLPLPHSTSNGSPNERWIEGTRLVKPQYPKKKMNLDAMFGIMRDATVDHRGVRYENLYYYSDELHEFRHRKGPKLPVKIKVNPSDISKIYVLDNDRLCLIECRSVNATITSGLSLFCHSLILKREKELFGRSGSDETYLSAKLDLERLLSVWVKEDFGVGINARVARACGLGTHNSNKMELAQQTRPEHNRTAQTLEAESPTLQQFKKPNEPLVLPTLSTSQLPK